jgi:hypothetical protein
MDKVYFVSVIAIKFSWARKFSGEPPAIAGGSPLSFVEFYSGFVLPSTNGNVKPCWS